MKPNLYFAYPRFAALYGAEVANEVAGFQLSHVLTVKDLVDKEQIDCDFQLTGACDAMVDQSHVDQVTASFNKIKASGAGCVREVQYIGPRDAEQVSNLSVLEFTSLIHPRFRE